MRIRTIALASAALSVGLVLTGCSMQSMDMGSGSSSEAKAQHNSADVMFASMMIAHHQQAIEMSDMVLSKTGVDPQVTSLAKDIKAAQGPEIDTMNGWLKEWGQPTGMSGMGEDGMMSDADMKALQDAAGPDSSKLFLTQMVQHHQGAIDMANSEISGGKDAAAVALAKKVVSAQTAEISKMQGLLASK